MRFQRTRLHLMVILGVGLGCAGVKQSGTSGESGGTGGGVSTTGGRGSSTGGTQGRPPQDGTIQTPGDAANNCDQQLRIAVRDFRGGVQDNQPKHPDFEQAVVDDRVIVASMLGPDSKPVYAPGSNGMTPTTTGQSNFDQWYRDVDGVNVHVDVTIPLTPDPTRAGVFVYDNDKFFPIDKMGLVDPYADHNHDFTAEIHFSFPYRGGEVFNFRGDDDVFVFINGHLAINLGGIHIAETGKVDLDARAAELGITSGNTYQMDVFYADRHCCDSTFHIETTLQCIRNIIVP